MHSYRAPLLLGLLMTLAAGPAFAQVNRCTGPDGKVSFSDTVCNGERAQKTFGVNASARGWTVEPGRAPAERVKRR